MSKPVELTVSCDIAGYASPRWLSAGSDAQRVANNEHLSQRRADAFLHEFKAALTRSLGNMKLHFLSNVSFAEGQQPDQTIAIGARGVGERDSIARAGGNVRNNDPKYRKVDVTVRIGRSTQDDLPDKVTVKFERTTKSHDWYVRVGVSGSAAIGVGATFFRLNLRNTKGDTASGSVVASTVGVGGDLSYSPASWTDEASFRTNREVGFDDFHGTTVRYTTGSLVLGIGYSRDYLTFYGMGSGAASLNVGGFTTGVNVGAAVAEGILILDTVPYDYTIDSFDTTEWQTIRSDWLTEQTLSVYYENAQWVLDSGQIAEIKKFAWRVAVDVRSS